MSRILNFLFGRFPKIFKENQVHHDLDPHSWKEWKGRYQKSEEYNWRRHSGKRHESKLSSHSGK